MIYRINGPLVKVPDFFGGFSEKMEQFAKDSKIAKDFYKRLFSSAVAVRWTVGHSKRLGAQVAVFSVDTKTGGYRISYFDNFGAIRHASRSTVAELVEDEWQSLPTDRRKITVLIMEAAK